MFYRCIIGNQRTYTLTPQRGRERTHREGGNREQKGGTENRWGVGWGAETKERKALVGGEGGGGAMSVFKEDLKELREVHDGQNADSIRS